MARLLLMSLLVGIMAGFGTLVFNFVVDSSVEFFMGAQVGYHPPLPAGEGTTIKPEHIERRWLFFVIPALGGLLAGLTVHWLAPDAGGHGTDSVIDGFHRHGGQIRKRIPLVKTIATAFTLGSGGSAGREGPITQVGAGLASMLGEWFHISASERRMLILAGAGLGAMFRAPLGGALFVTEVLYREVDFETPALVPAFVSSITAYFNLLRRARCLGRDL